MPDMLYRSFSCSGVSSMPWSRTNEQFSLRHSPMESISVPSMSKMAAFIPSSMRSFPFC